ncbi:hypothetical protein LLEC1_03654 [Akanthomyces lecanii]|uniref:Indole-diterpene biosynthesis protein PaxU n=1 Tax=Cordyceps confragosa TaxID=2714763 RepID=A0A179IBK8_CORDF|nr:hypothetical protein LLEC1_03654 [Akanthomyces lecanii]
MSRVNTDSAAPANPLGFMQRLSPSVTYYEPTTSTIASGSNNAQAEPELILLSTWMGARENHIAKYVQGYRVAFPTSRILVAQCPFTHVVLPFLAWTQIRPAVPILKGVVVSEAKRASKDDASSVLTGTSTAPRVLIHAFSNGGVSTTLFLYKALKRSLDGTFTLPQHVFIFDSCPGTFRWRNTARAIMKILPRWYSPAVHVVLFSVWLFYRIMPLLQPRQNVNSRTIRNPRFQEFEIRRTYLYGTDDHMIPPTDVEHEAALAAEAGFNVRLERFEDATHVAIPMLHPERYWRVVKESWHGEEPDGMTSVVVGGAGGDSGNLMAEIGSETVTREISLVDQEKPISEEASILVEDVKRDGKGFIQAVENTAQEVSRSAQSVVETTATKAEEVKQQSLDAAEKAQSKVEASKADTHTAIEQGQAKVKQFKANAAGAAKEVQIKANRKGPSKETNNIVEEFKADAANAFEEDEDVAVTESDKNAELSARLGGKVDKSTVRPPKAKPLQAEHTRVDETAVVAKPAGQAPAEQKPAEQNFTVEDKAKKDEQSKIEQPKAANSNKPKKSKKNGKK